MKRNILSVVTVINYIENNLTEKLNLEIVANAVHYSKYHLHRIFINTVGLTIHDYILRRKLTESAKMLVFSNKTIMEIALISGYESQQAFTTVFKHMYKKSPNQYRKEKEFYPLQLRYILNDQLTKATREIDWKEDIRYALNSDLEDWMDLVTQVIDGFPYLKEEEYRNQLEKYIQTKQAFIMYDGNVAVGAMTISKEAGSIDFLGVHPQYKKQEIITAFLKRLFHELLRDIPICITTFREEDKADLGYREIFKRLGFVEAELLIEFGYPTQRFILHKDNLEENYHE